MHKAFGLLVLIFMVSSIVSVEGSTLSHSVLRVKNESTKPNQFQATLEADEQPITWDDVEVQSLIYKDYNQPEAYLGRLDQIPIPQIEVTVGDLVEVTFRNQLECESCASSIHWHGIEVDNDSDGSGVTQNRVNPGEEYTYRFIAPRPGVFWFHPHMKPGPQTFAGMYGVVIVKDPQENELIAKMSLPSKAQTHTFVLGDIEFDQNGKVGYLVGQEAFSWGMLKAICQTGAMSACGIMVDARTVLKNGAAEIPSLQAPSQSGVRLQLINTSTNRYFRLRLMGQQAEPLYRVGGEGGLLEYVRIEGGIQGTRDSKFQRGEIVLPPSSRADVVFKVSGDPGSVMSIEGLGYLRGGRSNGNPAGMLLNIVVGPATEQPYEIDEGDPLLGFGAIERLAEVESVDLFLNPPLLPGPGGGLGSSNPVITMVGAGPGQGSIDRVIGEFDDSGEDYREVPYQASTRYAYTGDLLEYTVRNGSREQHHPFHHHGFSFQPIKILDSNSGDLLYNYDYAEFIDVVDVFPGESVVLRMRLQNRPRIADTRQELGAPLPGTYWTAGGAAGRWLFHCHIVLHSALGMISELVVLDIDRDGDGFDTSLDCDDFNAEINPSAREVCGDRLDNNCNGLIDEDDVPPSIQAHPNVTSLWPPNGKLQLVQFKVSVQDECDPNPSFTLVSIEATGDYRGGSFFQDASFGEPDTSIELKAARKGISELVEYLITYEASDSAGNKTQSRVTIEVPHDQRR